MATPAPTLAFDPLPLEIHRDGRTLRQLKRNDKAAIYELYGPQGWLYGYEVVKIRIQEPKVVYGMLCPRREVYPAPKEWGLYGFSYGSKYQHWAEERFRRFSLQLTGCITEPAVPVAFKRPRTRSRNAP